LGKEVVVCHPDPTPTYLKWVPDVACIENFDGDNLLVKNRLLNADLIFSLDYNEPSRLGDAMGVILVQSNAKKIMIDHHLMPADFTDLMLSDTSSCSTCQLVFDLIEGADWMSHLSVNAAVSIYLGIMTDTGSFRFPSVQPRTHEIIAKLLAFEINHSLIHEAINDVNTLDRLRLKGFACSDKLVVNEKDKYAYITLTQEELERYNYQKGDTEGLVNVILSIEGFSIAAFFMETNDGVKISFRSKGDYFVNEFSSRNFQGGGHQYAAGGFSPDSLEKTLERFESLTGELA
jgi:phosphoesterase RecJ-like protein